MLNKRNTMYYTFNYIDCGINTAIYILNPLFYLLRKNCDLKIIKNNPKSSIYIA